MPPDDPFAEFGGKMDEDPFAEFGGKMEAAPIPQDPWAEFQEQPYQPLGLSEQEAAGIKGSGQLHTIVDRAHATRPQTGWATRPITPRIATGESPDDPIAQLLPAPSQKKWIFHDGHATKGEEVEEGFPFPPAELAKIRHVYNKFEGPDRQRIEEQLAGTKPTFDQAPGQRSYPYVEFGANTGGQMVGRKVYGPGQVGKWMMLEDAASRAAGGWRNVREAGTMGLAGLATGGLGLGPGMLSTAASLAIPRAIENINAGASPNNVGRYATNDALEGIIAEVTGRALTAGVGKLLPGKKPGLPAPEVPAAANPVDDALRATVDDMSPEDAAKALQELLDNPPPPNMAATVEDMAKAIPEAPKPLPRAPVETPQVPSAAPATAALSKNQMKRAVQAHAERQALEQSAPKPKGVTYVKATVPEVYAKILDDAPKTQVLTKEGWEDAVEVSGKWVSNRGKVEEFRGLIHADPNKPSIGALRRPVIEDAAGMQKWAEDFSKRMGPEEFEKKLRDIARIEKMPDVGDAKQAEILEWFRTHPRGKTSGRGAPDPRDTGRLRFTEDEILRPDSDRFGKPGHSTPAVRDFVELKVGNKTYRFLTPDEVPVETPETAQALRDLVQPRVSGGVPSGAPEALPGAPVAPGGLQAETAGLQPETVSAARRFLGVEIGSNPTGAFGHRLAAKALAQRDKDLAKGWWKRTKGKGGFRSLVPFGVGTAAAQEAGIPWHKAVLGMATGSWAGRLVRPYALDAAAKILTRPQSPLTPAWRAAAYSLAERQRREKAATPPPR